MFGPACSAAIPSSRTRACHLSAGSCSPIVVCLLRPMVRGPPALVARLRPWLWTLMLGLHFTLIVLIDFADLSLGMVMVHLFTFDPAWVKVRPITATELLFYDGHCGLCHRAVRFVLAEDVGGKTF